MTKYKLINKWQVRYCDTAMSYSDQVGHKGRLLDLSAAASIVRRLKRRGVDAFRVRVPVSVAVSSR